MNVVLIAQTAGTANTLERTKLALIDARAPVLRVVRIRRDANDRPLVYEEVVLPLDRLPDMARDDDVTFDIFELAQRHALSLGRVTERISSVRATGDIALHLAIAPTTDVVKLDRVIETIDGQPIEWCVAFCNR